MTVPLPVKGHTMNEYMQETVNLLMKVAQVKRENPRLVIITDSGEFTINDDGTYSYSDSEQNTTTAPRPDPVRPSQARLRASQGHVRT